MPASRDAGILIIEKTEKTEKTGTDHGYIDLFSSRSGIYQIVVWVKCPYRLHFEKMLFMTMHSTSNALASTKISYGSMSKCGARGMGIIKDSGKCCRSGNTGHHHFLSQNIISRMCDVQSSLNLATHLILLDLWLSCSFSYKAGQELFLCD